MKTPANELLCRYVLDTSSGEPVARRVKLYRALAATLPEGCERFNELTSLADDLEAIDRRSEQLRLNLGEEGKP